MNIPGFSRMQTVQKENDMRMLKYMKVAYDLAQEYKYDPSLEYNLCAVIVKGGKILSVGYNKRGWNAFTEHYKQKEHTSTVHAEMDAILSKRKKIRFEGAKIYIVRIKANGNVGSGKPCEMCQHVLYNYGIKRVYYTTDQFPSVDSMKVDNPAKIR